VEVSGVSDDGTVVDAGVVDSDVVCEVSTGTVFGELVVVIGIFFVSADVTADFLGVLLENFLKNFFFGFFALFFFPAGKLLSLFFVQVVVD
jgi:hypothetical protein